MKLPKMEVLPEELQGRWGKQQFKECPESVYHIPNGLVSTVSTDYSKKEEVSKATVETPLPSLWERRLNVEDELLQKSNGNDEYTCILQEIAVKFVENSPTFPLTISNDYLGKCTNFPGVYLIYYIGKTSLYEDLVSSSRDQPIYVGMSESDILVRLNHHYDKVAESYDLKEKDFVVRVLIVDVEYYAPCIEGMLIEYYNPLWNDKSVKFSFGNSDDEDNNWNKYHVAKDEDTRKDMIKRVRKYDQDNFSCKLTH